MGWRTRTVATQESAAILLLVRGDCGTIAVTEPVNYLTKCNYSGLLTTFGGSQAFFAAGLAAAGSQARCKKTRAAVGRVSICRVPIYRARHVRRGIRHLSSYY